MKSIMIILAILSFAFSTLGNDYILLSPDQRLKAKINIGAVTTIQLLFDGQEIFTAKEIGLDIEGIGNLGRNGKIKNTTRNTVNRQIIPEIKEKFASIKEEYNELQIDFENNFSIVFRAYDEGMAYRFITTISDQIIVNQETLMLNFNSGDRAIYQQEKEFRTSYESAYKQSMIGEVAQGSLCVLPYLVDKKQGPKLLIAESDLVDYPGMWLEGTGPSTLNITFPNYPLKESYAGNIYGQGQVTERASFIAKTSGNRAFPWRVFIVAEHDADLITNQLVYLLASPLQLEDISWIEPGIVTFDWWGRRNIYGVNFKAGINTKTAKYFIDFAAEFGLEYFLFDDGWTSNYDLFKIHPDLDMEEITTYARKKGVKIMLWLIWSTFDRQMQEALDLYKSWGIAGIKVDFMNRDDQKMVNFYHKVAVEAAKRKMVVNFHGAYKPAGLRRAYPNVLTREALVEFEYNGGTNIPDPDHHNLLPYIRMVTGPMDYIPGTMNNSTKKNFRSVGEHPMGQGTRAHSIALFVILESPMQMLPDSPSDYYRERESMEFISQMPVEWDETIVLKAKIGDYTAIARRRDNEWFLGAITDWDPRELEITFDFLQPGTYQMEIIKDGINASTRAIDYIKQIERISSGEMRKIELASGGGWVARITPEKSRK